MKSFVVRQTEVEAKVIPEARAKAMAQANVYHGEQYGTKLTV